MKKSFSDRLKCILIIITLALITGCSLYEPGTAFIESGWSATSVSRGISENLEISRSVSFPSSEIYADSRWDNYGDVVMTLTPEQFRVPFDGLKIFGPETYATVGATSVVDAEGNHIEPTEDSAHSDFTSSIELNQQYVISPGTYTTFMIIFNPSNSATGYVMQKHDILVEIPGYTDVELPNIENQFPDIPAPSGYSYERYYLGNNKFRFTMRQLEPNFNGYALQNFVFSTVISGNDVAIAGFDGLGGGSTNFFSLYDVLGFEMSLTDEDYLQYQDDYYGISQAGGNGAITLTPMPEPLVLEEGGYARITVSLDTIDLIAVYDNGTSGNKSDDIVKFVPRFWERFSVAIDQ